jgi:hypothetical protein
MDDMQQLLTARLKEVPKPLRPSDYVSGNVPPGNVYQKPGLFYNEAETFAKRVPGDVTNRNAFAKILEDLENRINNLFDSRSDLIKNEPQFSEESYNAALAKIDKSIVSTRKLHDKALQGFYKADVGIPSALPREPSIGELEYARRVTDKANKAFGTITRLSQASVNTAPKAKRAMATAANALENLKEAPGTLNRDFSMFTGDISSLLARIQSQGLHENALGLSTENLNKLRKELKAWREAASSVRGASHIKTIGSDPLLSKTFNKDYSQVQKKKNELLDVIQAIGANPIGRSIDDETVVKRALGGLEFEPWPRNPLADLL